MPQEIPQILDAQFRMAFSGIPADYWNMNCWKCREEGHSTFICPYITVTQRVYFTYCYYNYQVQANPRMADWIANKNDRRPKNGPKADPRPPRGQYRPRRRPVRGGFTAQWRGATRGELPRGVHIIPNESPDFTAVEPQAPPVKTYPAWTHPDVQYSEKGKDSG